MSETPRTYEEIANVVNEFFADIDTRVKAVQNFALAMVLENALAQQEIILLKSELEGMFELDPDA